MQIVILLAEAFLAAYLLRTLAFRFGIPSVTGYVIAGVVLGGTLFAWVPGGDRLITSWLYSEDALEQLSFISRIAIGTIAITIGVELEWKRICQLGRSIISIAITESMTAFALVLLFCWLLTRDIALSMVLGAIASGTAPAATVSVIQRYKARGPLTHTILAVVSIDDAISFFIFAFSITMVKGWLGGNEINLMTGLVSPVIDIAVALGIGAAVGFVGGWVLRKVHDQESMVFVLAAVILWTTGIAGLLDVSELLANMTAGMMIVNMYPHLMPKIRLAFASYLPVFYALFFIIGGAHLSLGSLPVIWGVALVYFLARFAGKVLGASAGAVIGKASPQVRKGVGSSLLPQVGAAIALALVVQQEVGSGMYGDRGDTLSWIVINVLLVTTVLTESIGPYLTKLSLAKAGETRE